MDAEELGTDTDGWKLGHFLSLSDLHTDATASNVTLSETGGVYCTEVLSRTEQLHVLMAYSYSTTALSPSSSIIIVI